MAIKIGGTTVIDNSQNFDNIISLDLNNNTIAESPVGITHKITTSYTMDYLGAGTITLSPHTHGNFSYFKNNAAFTLEAPTKGGRYTMVIYLLNQSAAGAITLSGFNRIVGDSLTTTNGDKFLLYVTKSSGGSNVILSIVSLQ